MYNWLGLILGLGIVFSFVTALVLERGFRSAVERAALWTRRK